MSDIKYWTPVQNAWEKMVEVLFRPFELGKWMVIGFTAFLANCGRESAGNSNFNSNGGGRNRGSSSELSDGEVGDAFSEIGHYISDAWAEHAQLILVIGCSIILLIIALTILVNWLNGRGQFMFLDNVLKNRGAVKEPWREYRKEGNSLMFFQIVLDFIVSVSMLALIGGIVMSIFPMIVAETFSGENLVGIIVLGLLFIVLCIVYGFLKMVLTHFVVPLMYQRRFSIREGFRAFQPILRSHFWRIVLFGLVLALVNGAVGVAVVLGILLTCCTALILLVIPYIGTVVLLPIYVFIRFIGPEFLRQFGDDYDLLKDSPLTSKEPPPFVEEDVPEPSSEV